MSINKLSLLLQLLNINITRPNNSSKYPNKGVESGDKRPQLCIVGLSQEAEENVHHHRNEDHYNSNVDVRVIQASD